MSSEQRSVNHVEHQCPKCGTTTWQHAKALVSHVCNKNKYRETYYRKSEK